MRKALLMLLLLLTVLVPTACAPAAAPAPQSPALQPPATAPASVAPSAPAKPAWQAKWEQVLDEAKKEGRVMLATSGASETRTAMVEGFGKAYGLPVEAVAARSAQTTAKVLAERRAGLYLWDVTVGGTTTPLTQLKPVGAIEPLDPALIVPDVTDPDLIKKTWYRGELWWVDPDHTLLASLMFPYPPLAVNPNLVKPEEIKSYNDLLDPKWKGKLSFYDPMDAGTTLPSFLLRTYGPDWMRKLARQQEPIIMVDGRLQADWLVHGKVPIALGIKGDVYTQFKMTGAPIQAVTPKEGGWLSAGSGGISMFNRPAHPNAVKVFINWLLSKEGQTTFSKAYGGQSAREDVPTDFLLPEQIRQPGVKYWEKEREEANIQKAEDLKLCKEIFGFLMK